MDLTFNQYQAQTQTTARYPAVGGDPLVYPVLKLNGEAGEVAEKLGKIHRDQEGVMTPADKRALVLELGDCLWYIAQIAKLLDTPLDDVARLNLDKLAGRVERGTLKGSGDDR